jgi:hypothetical protein
MQSLVTDVLLADYVDLVAAVGEDASDEEIIAALVADYAWTVEGAESILVLARSFGVSILRNALALASAMKVEDGTLGL